MSIYFLLSLFPSLFFLIVIFIWLRKLIFGTAIKGELLTHKLDDNYYIRVVDFVNKSKSCIIGVCGEAHSRVFNEDVIEAMKRAHRRGVKISLVCGPLILSPSLTELAAKGIVVLYRSERRQPRHFWATPEGRIHYEYPHGPGDIERRSVEFIDNVFEAKWLIRNFELIINNKRSFAGKSIPVTKYNQKSKKFVTITGADLPKVVQETMRDNMEFDDYSGDDLKRIISDMGIEYQEV